MKNSKQQIIACSEDSFLITQLALPNLWRDLLAYLSQLIRHYQPTRTLRSSDKLLLFVPKVTLALSAKALLQSGTHCRINVDPLSFSALSSVLWKPSCLTLPIVNVNTLPSLCHCVPLIRLRHMALCKCVIDLIWTRRKPGKAREFWATETE